MRRRKTIKNLVEKKRAKIKILENELEDLYKENCLLSDKKQWFIEKEEEFLICGRPKKYETKLIGRVHWVEVFIDEDTGDGINIDRSRIVRIDGEWK